MGELNKHVEESDKNREYINNIQQFPLIPTANTWIWSKTGFKHTGGNQQQRNRTYFQDAIEIKITI